MSRKSKHTGNALPAADYSPLNIPDAVPIPYDTPASPLYGVGLAALNDGLKVFVDPYVGMRLGDRVEVYWDDSDTPFAFVDVDEANLNNVLALTLDASLFINGDFHPRYEIVRESATVAVSPSRDIRVILSLPGGPDPDPSTPHNENLAAPLVPDDILQNGVDASQAAQGVPVTIEPYLNMGEYDRIDFSWGGQRRTRYVMPGEPGSAITFTIEEVQILAAGDGSIQLMYQVIDAAANRSAGWSLVTVLDVFVQGAVLDEPIVDKATDGVLQLADLNGEDALVKVLATSENFSVGNTVELTWAGTTEAGEPRDYSATQTVAAVPGEIEFQVPYADVAAIVQGNAVVSYVLHKGAGNDLQSRRTQVQVLGSTQQLPAPMVREASGDSLAADTAQATVDIAAYAGMAAGDLVTLYWQGLTADGIPLPYSEEKTISGGGVGKTVTFTLPGANYVEPLDGGSVTLYYSVTGQSGTSESERLQLNVGSAAASLPAPTVREAVNNVLAADVLQATVDIQPYPDMAANDRVDLYWVGNVSGEFTDWLPVSSATVGHVLNFTVYPESIEPNSSADVSYSVTRAAGGVEASAVLHLGIGEVLPLPAPTIDQAVDDLLDPADVPNGATVRIAAAANLEAGDMVTVHWIGTSGAGSIDIDHPVSGGQVGKDITVVVPLAVVQANAGNSIQLSYDIARFSGGIETSPVSIYRIGESVELPPPSIDEAGENELDISAVPNGATVRIPASAALEEGDEVSVHWEGQPGAGSTVVTHSVTAGEAGQDLTLTIPLSVVEADMGTRITLYYVVERAAGGTQTSPSVTYEIVESQSVWNVVSSMIEPHAHHLSYLLHDGTVLVAAGDLGSRENAINDAELYDPATNGWSTTTPIPSSNGATEFASAILESGAVLLSQGRKASSGLNEYTWAFNNASQEWTTIAHSFGSVHWRHTITQLFTGEILQAGGTNNSTLFNDAYLYPADAGTIDIGDYRVADLFVGRYNHSATLLDNGEVFIMGGHGANEAPLRDAEIFDPLTKTWQTTGTPLEARSLHRAILLPSGKVLIVGGQNLGGVLKSAELYDPTTGRFSATGSLSQARWEHTATLLSNGKVLVTGGMGYNNAPLATAELYDPNTETWVAVTSMNEARTGHTAVLLPEDKVLVAGGVGIDGSALSTAEMFERIASSR
ncbi:Kelch repeat-containing protein [Pseudomonas knackmussii]|uniref:Kelch repeat-containing protein n=1 Tax=Pseudomonas knackmussii TaxID=65741 RepID=UPI0013642E65|nr:kelch motif-containing protein [Pseudomonas knackmussii]